MLALCMSYLRPRGNDMFTVFEHFRLCVREISFNVYNICSHIMQIADMDADSCIFKHLAYHIFLQN